MREILFRGKRADNGEWSEGSLLYDSEQNESYIAECFEDKAAYLREVAPETVGQFTGLTDKYKTKIFEGDVCRFREWSKGNMCWIGEVHYEHQQFVISGNPNEECESPFTLVMSRFVPENIEVIGNIHDNPELLKGGEAE